MNLKHYAISGVDFSVKGRWMQKLLQGDAPAELKDLEGKKGLLFSNVVLNQFIEDDFKYETSVLSQTMERSFRTFSSGEKRKALLNYLLKQEPDFLVLDNPFDSLDEASVAELKLKLKKISETTVIIQVFKRRGDLLPFIDTILEVDHKSVKKNPAVRFVEDAHMEKSASIKSIPEGPVMYSEIPEILVSLKNVSVSYHGKPILNKINWEIKKGDFWQLIGPNGSGKTTILSMIYGDNPKAFGVDLYLFGNKKGSGESVWEIKKKIGYFSPAHTELFSRRNTVLEMLISGLLDSVGLYQKPTDKEKRLAKSWLKTLHMENIEGRIFTELPELEQRKVLIGRAMIKHPLLLILDEPTTSLDDKNAREITSLINRLTLESETAVVFVSHRKEKGLEPKRIYRLIPSEEGSKGEIQQE